MNLSLAHPSCCGCLPCLNRRKGSTSGLSAEHRLLTNQPSLTRVQCEKAGSVSGAPRVTSDEWATKYDVPDLTGDYANSREQALDAAISKATAVQS